MAESAEKFAQLLTEGIHRIRRREGKRVSVIQDEIGYALGREGGSAIEYWRKGHTPVKMTEVVELAKILFRRGQLDQVWLEQFLDSGGYNHPGTLWHEMFSSDPGGALQEETLGKAPEDVNETGQNFPLKSSATLHNLPIQSTPFIGRKRELAALAQLLANANCRLITLLGIGGIGKTRLALQAAAEMNVTHPQSVIFIPLVSLTSAEFLYSSIATSLNFTFSGNRIEEMHLLTYLSTQELLLVLDNFEHLLNGVTQLSNILQQAPLVKLLVTSRERLNLQGEWIFDVGGLETPSLGGKVEETVFEDNSSVALFLQRIRQIQPDFTLSEAEKAAIVRICQLVQGVPLAIELAAAWGRVLSCVEIAQELEHGLGFLTGTLNDIPMRHRSIRDVFEYSWQLLSPEEQYLLAQLSIFRGAFTCEAAFQVASASLSLISMLIDKSLLHRNPKGFEMHEITRQFAALKLQEMDETEVTRQRHEAYFVALAEEELHQLSVIHFHPQYILQRKG